MYKTTNTFYSHLARLSIMIILLLMCSCNDNENTDLKHSIENANIKKENKFLKKNDNLNNDCIFKRNGRPIDEYFDKMWKIKREYMYNYSPKVIDLLKSRNIESVKKALLYMTILPPLEAEQARAISNLLNEYSNKSELNQLNFPQLINQYDWKQIGSDENKYNSVLHAIQIYPRFKGLSAIDAIFTLFDYGLSKEKANSPKYLTLKTKIVDVLVEYFPVWYIVELFKHYNLYETGLEDALYKMKQDALATNSCIKSNEFYYYSNTYTYKFLNDKKYRDQNLENMIEMYRNGIVENLKSPSEMKDTPKLFKYYYKLIHNMFIDKVEVFCFDDNRLKWTEKLNSWIHKTIEECNEIVKEGEVNDKGEIKYFSYNLNNDVSYSIKYMFKLWMLVAPIKACAFLQSCFQDEILRNYYIKFIFKKHIYDEWFVRDIPYYLLHQKLYVKTFLNIIEIITNNDNNNEMKSFVRTEIIGFAFDTLGRMSRTSETDERGRTFPKEFVLNYTIDEWRQFFCIETNKGIPY